MPIVFVLHHTSREGTASEDVKFIGIYSTEELARQAIARLSKQPGFNDSCNGFHIDRYEMDVDHWKEGFQ